MALITLAMGRWPMVHLTGALLASAHTSEVSAGGEASRHIPSVLSLVQSLF